MKPPAPLAALFLGFALIGGLSELGIALAQQPSIEEHMVTDTDAVLGILRTWHNQISQDQAIIKDQARRIEGVTTILPGEPGQILRWSTKDTKWEWVTPPPPADKPVEAPGK